MASIDTLKKYHKEIKELKDLSKRQQETIKKQENQIKQLQGRLQKYVNLPEVAPVKNKQQEVKQTEEKQQKEYVVKKDWKCHECKMGEMKLTVLSVGPTGTKKYFRKCTNPKCNHRTHMKTYTDEVVQSP